MGTGILFPICALFFSILIVILFFSKEHYKTVETKLYGYIIVTNLVGLIIELLCTVASYIYQSHPIISIIILKLYLVYIITWALLFTIYIYYISNPLEKIKKNSRIGITISSIFMIISIVMIFILPIDVIIENNFQTRYTAGPSVDFTYFMSFILVIVMVWCLIKNFKNLKNKKYIPLIVFLNFGFIGMIFQKLNPSILMMTYIETFVSVLMYHTIENPDVKMIEQLNVAREQADKANKAKTEFLSNMSHEIRTPLNAIVGFSNILLEDEDVPEKSKDEIKDIVMASDNLLEIVNGILDISKIEANKIEIVNNEYSIKKVLDDLVALTKGRIAEKPLEFKVNIDETIPPVLYGDSQRIKQICVNILTNAVKYTKEGWIELKVSHIKIDNICRLIISVEDTGIGIKEGNIDKLFDKFERLDLNDNVTIEGTGLGLAITKKLVDLMGGKIVVQSVFGKGSRFTVSLDQRIVENPTIALDDIPETKNEEIKVEGKKVLIVDDNKINIKVAERLLDNYSVLHDSVESGLDCINKIKEGNKYDLILMDDMMPKMSGTEAFHELEKIPGFNVPVIALTANALTGMKEKYLGEGFSDYLAKPINKDELNRIINTFLNQE